MRMGAEANPILEFLLYNVIERCAAALTCRHLTLIFSAFSSNKAAFTSRV
jgi:hypothetical protein